MTHTRNITTYYTDADDVEHDDLTVSVCADGPCDILIESDLPDMPEAEEQRLRERVAELYWAAQNRAYMRSAEAERDGE